jgi:signal peptidase I
MREITPLRAVLASIAGFGYVYVGRIGLALLIPVAVVAALAAIAWSRLIFTTGGFVALVGSVIAYVAIQLVHPALVAARRRQAPRRFYNRWWLYALWSLALIPLNGAFSALRGPVFGYEMWRVPAVSMAPTVDVGDWVMTDAWRYRATAPAVGEIVVFDRPGSTSLLKRVVGIAGDRIEFREGMLYRNGEPVAEPYLHVPEREPLAPELGPFTVGADELFVLGDYRDNSLDSRFFGPINSSQVRGRAESIVFSHSGSAVNWERFPTYFGEN